MLTLNPIPQFSSFKQNITAAIMPKNKNKILGTSSLKVKPKKRPGLIKQLSQPFMPNKKNKKAAQQEEKQVHLFSGYDDMFLPNDHKHVETVYLSEEKEIETFLNFDKTPLKIRIPQDRGNRTSGDSGYASSPPVQNEMLSPTGGSTPAKGILKKTNVSPELRSASPHILRSISEQNVFLNVPAQNGRCTPDPVRALSPVDRAMSPFGMESIENALGFLDNVIEEEKKMSKKSVSFGDIAEVKNFLSDSSDNDICDDYPISHRNVSFGDVEDVKRLKDECNQSFKKSVSFEDIYAKHSLAVDYDDRLTRSQSCEQIPLHDTDSSEEELEYSEPEKTIQEKSEKVEKLKNETVDKLAEEVEQVVNEHEDCGCESVCTFEVEVKVVDIQPRSDYGGQGQDESSAENSDIPKETCTLLDTFNILVRYLFIFLVSLFLPPPPTNVFMFRREIMCYVLSNNIFPEKRP